MSKSFMICNDLAHERQNIRKILTKHEHIVLCDAINGNQAVEFYQEFQPEVSLVDISLTGKDGVEVLEAILKINPEANVILMSSLGHKAFVNSCIESGAKAVITKPLSEKKILEAIDKI